MFLKIYTPLLLLFFCYNLKAQENLSAFSIPSELKEHANAVVRLSTANVEISSRKSMKVNKKKVITFFNETGFESAGFQEYFSDSEKIKSLQAIIYNAAGSEIKKIRKKDFKMVSVSQGAGITDNKVLYLDYTPVQYPFTVVYESEVETINTVFISPWAPVDGLFTSVEKSEYTITYDPSLGFRYKEYNTDDITVTTQKQEGQLKLTCQNVHAIKAEAYTPYSSIMPKVMFSLTSVHLEGVDGEFSDWASFGAWYYNNLLVGTDELPDETKAKIKELVGTESDKLKKAKIVYKYVQDKTRYVSIQLGIGGWRPMLAKDVDRLGYGDCKALSNYTRALLKEVGVESYCTVIYGDTRKRDITNDFVCMQGNHMILAIPDNDEMIWLECTSQVVPFAFQGDFTDDRMALVLKPEGGELIRTHVYENEESSQLLSGNYTLSESGKIVGGLTVVSKGIQYDNKYILEGKSQDDLNKIYKSRYFSNINNLKLNKIQFSNNRNDTEFTEVLELEGDSYASLSGDRLIFAINAFNQNDNVPQRYRKRYNPFEVLRGYSDNDEIVVTLPQGYTIEAMPNSIDIKEKFGEYRAECNLVEGNKLVYKRTLVINKGMYEKTDYDLYRQFREKISRNDNAKVVLLKQ
ncbi:DUF3857 domain-containing protein [Flavobacterium rakeshii]|uniref:DUF3857 domain-containing protein n=1 Tax=Flavobacterium rakeshii TaxID=1038845 RepID=A0A6N8HBQ0_9FLAO|nr:DUF3857 domain-containing protein [Flavobacterium rakeshii]MUV02616.1 DUF3857 domain-containing protein [Flavobacterium rakeshii]